MCGLAITHAGIARWCATPPLTTPLDQPKPTTLNLPGLAVTRASIASVVCRSSGPALRCSLFCRVCLISAFRSLGMSLLQQETGNRL